MADAFLRHVCQRIDALTYDDHSPYLLGSLRAADVPLTPVVSSGTSLATSAAGATLAAGTPRRGSFGATAVTVSSRRRRAHPRWAKLVGLTSYYVRFVLLVGSGWFFAMLGMFGFIYSFSALEGRDMRLSTAEAIAVLAMYFVGGAAGCVLFGSLGDHYGRRRVLLLAVGEWVVANALTGAAWGPASLLALRVLASLGISGELVMLVTISLEYAPKRTRGRITVVSFGLAAVGIVVGVWFGNVCVPALTWRASFGVISGAALLHAALVFAFLEESPKYLASTGRSAEALRVLAKMETAHGIDRQARITVPTSLYAPRPQQQQQQQQAESISEEQQTADGRRRALSELYHQPHHADFEEPREADAELKRQLRRESGDGELRGALGLGGGGRGGGGGGAAAAAAGRARARASDAAAEAAPLPVGGLSPGLVSFAQALRLRLAGVLLRSPLLSRTLLLWLLWLAAGLGLSTALAAVLLLSQLHTGSGYSDQLIWSAATVPGILLAAVLVERLGRKATLAGFLLASGVTMAATAGLLSSTSDWTKFVWANALLALTVTGTFGALVTFTGEQYPLMVRSLGMGLSAAAGHLGMFLGVYAVLHLVFDADAQWPELRVALAAAGGVVLLVALPLAALTGVETRGHDVDTLEWHALNSRKRLRQRHQRDFEDAADSHDSHGSSGSSREPPSSDGYGYGYGYGRDRHEARTSSLGTAVMLPTPSRTERAASAPAPDLASSRGAHRSSLPVLMASSYSHSPASSPRGSSHGSPPAAALSFSLSPSSRSSSSSSSGFWQKRSVHRLRRQVKAVADAVRARKTLSISGLSASGKKARALTGSSRAATLPSDDLDLLDAIVTDHELDGGADTTADALGRRRRAKSSGVGQRRRTRTASGAHSRWFVPALSGESVLSIGRWRQSSSAASSSSASSASSVELEPPVPKARRKSSRAAASRARRRPTDTEPVLEILEPTAFMDSGRFPLAEADCHELARTRRAGPGSKSSGDESNASIDLDMFDTFTSISTPVTTRGAAR